MLLTIGQSLNSSETTLNQQVKEFQRTFIKCWGGPYSWDSPSRQHQSRPTADGIDNKMVATNFMEFQSSMGTCLDVSNLSTQGFDYDLEIVLEILPRHHLISELFCATESWTFIRLLLLYEHPLTPLQTREWSDILIPIQAEQVLALTELPFVQ